MKLAIVIFSMFLPLVTSQSIDLTLQSKATGIAVTLRTVELIQNSAIFNDDHDMLRRLAFIETRDGGNLSSNGGGIWRISAPNLGKLQDNTYNVTSFRAAIQSKFSITWSTVTYADLEKPLYSGLAARLILAHGETADNVTISMSNTQQYSIWSLYFYDNTPPISESQFNVLVDQLPSGCLNYFRDVVFVVDSSSAIPDDDFALIKTFLTSVVSHFNLSSSTTRFGILQYATDQLDILCDIADEDYEDYSDNEDDYSSDHDDPFILIQGRKMPRRVFQEMEEFFDEHLETLLLTNGGDSANVTSAITDMRKLTTEPVLTGIAISHAADMFTSDRTARTGVARIIVVITQQASVDDVTIPTTLAKADEIDIVAIGYGDAINETQLTAITQEGNITHSLYVYNATYLANVVTRVQNTVCNEQVSTPVGSTIQGSLAFEEYRTYSVLLDSYTTFTLQTSAGTASCYFSGTIQTPNNAFYDSVFHASVTNTQVNFVYNATESEYVYFSVVGTSQTTNDFVLTISGSATTTPVDTTTPPDTTAVPVTNATDTTVAVVDGGLSGGEIAGIVFAALILLCGLIVAFAYYCFSRRGTVDITKESKGKVEMNESVVKRPGSSPGYFRRTPSFRSENVSEVQATDEGVARKQLRVALTKNDVTGVQNALDRFKDLRLEDKDGDVIRGERLLSVQQCKDGISYSKEKKNIRYLERAIFEVKRRNFATELAPDLNSAEVMLTDLKNIENLMNRLRAAMDAGDMDAVENLSMELRSLRGCDQTTVDRMLDVHRIKGELEQATRNRDLAHVTSTLATVEEKGYALDIPVEVKRAKRMKKELELVEQARTDVLNLRQSEVSEIRSYSNPPTGVFEVMSAVYLLLGYPAQLLEGWSEVQSLMGRTGKESLRRQIKLLEPRNLDPRQARLAMAKVEPFELQQITSISTGLSMFYIFVRHMVGESQKVVDTSFYSPTPYRFLSETPISPKWNQSEASKFIGR